MRTEMKPVQRVLLLSALVSLGGFLRAPERAGAQVSAPYPGCERLGSLLEQHVCFHAEFGPFVSVPGDPMGAPANVDAVHTHYTLQLGGAGEVSYRPARDGAWSIFTSTSLPLVVLDAEDVEVPAQLDVDSAHCPQLQRAAVYGLRANVRYRFLLGPTEQLSVGLVLERLADFESSYYLDADSDGFGTPNDALPTACVPPAGRTAEGGDCDDAETRIHPLASETADGRDNDCDGLIDEGMGGEPTRLYYLDQDGDGFGDQESAFEAVSAPPGYIAMGGDCNDVRANIHPGASEVCDNLDNDCDGEFDEGFAGQLAEAFPRYLDYDGDGYGSPDWPVVGCGAAAMGAETDDDCDDVNPVLHPGARELCDGADNDCDEQVDVAPDGTDVCRECDFIQLRASWERQKGARTKGHALLRSEAQIRVPPRIAIAQGCAVGKFARLTFRTDRRTVHCHYLGLGPEYRLLRCTSGARAGREVAAEDLWLHVTGSPFCGPTQVDLTLAPTGCESSSPR